MEPCKFYLAPANYHISAEPDETLSLTTEGMKLNSRPSIDITLSLVGVIYREVTSGTLLTGANTDGAYRMKIFQRQWWCNIV